MPLHGEKHIVPAAGKAMADRESRNAFKEFDHGFRRELRFKK
jgi:hypothetical protein